MKAYLLSICFLIFACTHLQAQESNFVTKAKSSLDSFSNQYPQEKVFIHTDRNVYYPSETIWFKIYCMTDGLPSYVSKVAYVDLVNEAGLVLVKKMLYLNNAAASGNMNLSASLPDGKYIIRAYSLWMLNFPEFVKGTEITIYNDVKKSLSQPFKKADFTLRFFPEAGDLIAGIPTRVAFQALQNDGYPYQLQGKITNNSNKLITTFSTTHDGMGSFMLTASADSNYIATVEENGVEKIFTLPNAKPIGVSLQAEVRDTKIFLRVERRLGESVKPADMNDFYIIGQQLGQIVYQAKVNFEEGETAAFINKKNLLPGILQLTLFDKNSKPIAERLVFNNDISQKENITFLIDTLQLAPRKKNIFHIQTVDSNNPSISVSITDANLLPENDRENIISEMLLNADLHGKIYDPAYYLKSNDSTTIANTDLLMMVNGWRRFKWEEVLNHKKIPLSYIAEPGNSLSGKVVKAGNKNVEITDGRLDVLVRAVDSTVILNTIKLSDNGEFFIPDLNFAKSAKLYFQGTNLKKEKAYVKTQLLPAYIDTLKKINSNQFLEYFGKNVNENFGLPAMNVLKFVLDSTDKPKTLDEIKLYSKKRSEVDSINNLYASAMFTNSDNSIVVGNNTKYFNIWQLIRSQVSGIDISGDLNDPKVQFKRYAALGSVFASQSSDDEDVSENGVNTSNGIAYYLNEVNVSKDVIDNISINDVALIKVFKGTSSFILGAAEGAIAIYTNNGSAASDPRDRAFEMIKKTGFDVNREFYSPDYSSELTSISKDNRTTLYWNPEIKFDDKGKSKIQFYSSDISTKFFINIQGFDKDGRLFSIQKKIE